MQSSHELDSSARAASVIEHCKLANESLTSETVKRVLQMFSHARQMDLSHNFIGALQPRALPATVTELNLSHNKLTRIDGFELLSGLRELDLSHNLLSSTCGLACCQHLQRLDLSSNSIEKVEQLETLQSLEELDLRHNLLSSDNALRPLSCNGALAALALCGNPIAAANANGTQRNRAACSADTQQAHFPSRTLRITISHILPGLSELDGVRQQPSGSPACLRHRARTRQARANSYGRLQQQARARTQLNAAERARALARVYARSETRTQRAAHAVEVSAATPAVQPSMNDTQGPTTASGHSIVVSSSPIPPATPSRVTPSRATASRAPHARQSSGSSAPNGVSSSIQAPPADVACEGAPAPVEHVEDLKSIQSEIWAAMQSERGHDLRVAFHRSAQIGAQGQGTNERGRPAPDSLLLAPQKLLGIVQKLVPLVAPARLQHLINLCPANGDGLIEFAEFLLFCAGTAPALTNSPLRLRDLSLSSPRVRRKADVSTNGDAKAALPASGEVSRTQGRQRRRQQQIAVPQSPAQARAQARVRAAARSRARRPHAEASAKQNDAAPAVSKRKSMSASASPSHLASVSGTTSPSARFLSEGNSPVILVRPNLSINATGAPLLAGNPERARTSGARRAHTPRGDADKNANAKSRHQDSRLGNRGSSRGTQRSRRNVSPTQSRAPSQSHVQTPPPPPHAPTLHGQAQIPSVIDSGVSKTSEAAPNSSLQTMSAAAMAAGADASRSMEILRSMIEHKRSNMQKLLESQLQRE